MDAQQSSMVSERLQKRKIGGIAFGGRFDNPFYQQNKNKPKTSGIDELD